MGVIAASAAIWQNLICVGLGESSRMTSRELRSHFLLENLFSPGEIRLAYTEWDRMIIGGVVPVSPIELPSYRELGGGFFLARREAGGLNLGAPGVVRVGGERFLLDRLDCLYIG